MKYQYAFILDLFNKLSYNENNSGYTPLLFKCNNFLPLQKDSDMQSIINKSDD